MIIKTTVLVGGDKIILLKTVRSVEKTIIPFGIRLFGASFHGGYYYIPSLGRVFVSITNFRDELLIRADKGNYIITPRNPMELKALVEKSKV